MNNTPKFVVSKTLEEPLEWNNSTLTKADVAEEITEPKQRPGKGVWITGSPPWSGRCWPTSSGSWFIPSSWGAKSVSSRAF